MGIFIYNLIVRSYDLMVILFSRFNTKARHLYLGRKRAFRTIDAFAGKDGEALWFHCASLGEFEQGYPLMEAIRASYPEYRLYLSFFSPSGYLVQKDNPLPDGVFYLPSDSPVNARRLLDMLHPRAAFFIKYEFWYHYLKACVERDIPVYSISTILRHDQLFFKWYGGIYRSMLHMFNYLFVQNEETLALLKTIGITNAKVSGDTRFDRVYEIARRNRGNEMIAAFKGDDRLIVLGSTWKPDLDLWATLIRHSNGTKYIIAPHHVEEEDIRYVEKKVGAGSIRYSRAVEGPYDASVLILDNIGMLSAVYYYADLAYVGGSFSEGLHNILEPATYGRPVIMGKQRANRKFQEAVELLRLGGAFEVDSTRNLEILIKSLLSDRLLYRKASEACLNYVQQNLGSTKTIMHHLKTLFE